VTNGQRLTLTDAPADQPVDGWRIGDRAPMGN